MRSFLPLVTNLPVPIEKKSQVEERVLNADVVFQLVTAAELSQCYNWLVALTFQNGYHYG